MEWSERSEAEKKQIAASALAKVAHLARPSWTPVVEEGDGAPIQSKFSGSPWLAEGETWPTCPNCSRPMQLFLQLNLETIPAELSSQLGKACSSSSTARAATPPASPTAKPTSRGPRQSWRAASTRAPAAPPRPSRQATCSRREQSSAGSNYLATTPTPRS